MKQQILISRHFVPLFITRERQCGDDGDYIIRCGFLLKIDGNVFIDEARLAKRRPIQVQKLKEGITMRPVLKESHGRSSTRSPI